jgi:hypothetical protein
MDVAHQCNGQHDIRKAECPHKEREFEEPGYKADQEYHPHQQVNAPLYHLHIHSHHFSGKRIMAGKDKDICKKRVFPGTKKKKKPIDNNGIFPYPQFRPFSLSPHPLLLDYMPLSLTFSFP